MKEAYIKLTALFSSFNENYDYLINEKQITFANDYQENQRKMMLLSCASYFESKLKDIILLFLATEGCSLTKCFIEKKALNRQYHTLFDWSKKNANAFFSLFGEDFKDFMSNEIKKDEKLEQSIKDFLELGSLRNALVHDNFITYSLNLSVEDVRRKFLSAEEFLNKIIICVEEFKRK